MQRFTRVIVFEWSTVLVTLALVLLRLFYRVRQKNLSFFADGFVILAWLCFLSQAIMDTELYRIGFFNNELDILNINTETAYPNALKISYVENTIYHIGIYAIKAALLCFYADFIPWSMKSTRFCLWITVAATSIGFAIITVLNLVICSPLSTSWDSNENCLSTRISFIRSAITQTFHLLTGIMIYIIPLSVIRATPVTNTQKLGAGILFTVGFLCVCFTVAAVAISYLSPSVTVHWILSILEEAFSICVICATAFNGLTTSCSFQEWKNRISCNRGERRYTNSDTGTTTGSIDEESGTRPSSDTTLVYLGQPEAAHQEVKDIDYYVHTEPKSVSAMIAYEDGFYPSRPGRSPISIVPVESYIDQIKDGEYQTNSPSSPGYTVSVASIADFYDLERQLQLDDERRQAINCSPVPERKSSEQQSNIAKEVSEPNIVRWQDPPASRQINHYQQAQFRSFSINRAGS